MPAYLVIRLPGEKPSTYCLQDSPIIIGRKERSDLVIPLEYVSDPHGRLEKVGDVWQYTDLNSTNGTFFRNNSIRNSSVSLTDGDVLIIGKGKYVVELIFQLANETEQGELIIPPLATTQEDRLKDFPLTIGRSSDANLYLEDPTVSRRHAILEQARNTVQITDLNSANGTFVNGERVTYSRKLVYGDVVQIGSSRFIYTEEGFNQQRTDNGLRVDSIKVVQKVGHGTNEKVLLNEISISVYPGEFVALVGPSGAGKSTLMKALGGLSQVNGAVLINGDDLALSFGLYRTIVGYLPQEDIIHQELTVESALRYTARLRLPPDTTDQEIQKRINNVLEQVSMTGQRSQVISSLSGGQRKRVSIAAELLASPRLFFLDEPTSGLDPGLDKLMMNTLRSLADDGRTIILVTHATSNIMQCHLVCFLAQGRMVYYGPPQEAFDFFQIPSQDFADIYAIIDGLTLVQAQERAVLWEQRFKESSQYQRFVIQRQTHLSSLPKVDAGNVTGSHSRINLWHQFLILTQRYYDLVLRDRILRLVLLGIMPVIGLLLLMISEPNWLIGDSDQVIQAHLHAEMEAGAQSATYSIVGNGQQLLFMMTLAAVLLGLFAASYEINKEQHIFRRERIVNLRLLPYLISKVVVLGSFVLVQCFLLLFVVQLKVNLGLAGIVFSAPIEIYITLVLGAIAAILQGLFISAAISRTNAIIYIVLLILFLQIIFAGVIFDLPGNFGKGLSALTLSRWTMEGLGSSIDIQHLNSLTQTRLQPESVTNDIPFTVEKPIPGWEPVSVITETVGIPVIVEPGMVTQTVPISLPRVIIHEFITTTDVITRSVPFTPGVATIYSERHFQIEYDRSPRHLLTVWLILIGYCLLFGLGALFSLKRKGCI